MLEPSLPGPDEIGRLWTPGHREFMTYCRWCPAELRIKRGAIYCPACDGLASITTDFPHGTTTD